MMFTNLLNFLLGLDACVTWLEVQLKILCYNFVVVENSSVAVIWNRCTVMNRLKILMIFHALELQASLFDSLETIHIAET